MSFWVSVLNETLIGWPAHGMGVLYMDNMECLDFTLAKSKLPCSEAFVRSAMVLLGRRTSKRRVLSPNLSLVISPSFVTHHVT